MPMPSSSSLVSRLLTFQPNVWTQVAFTPLCLRLVGNSSSCCSSSNRSFQSSSSSFDRSSRSNSSSSTSSSSSSSSSNSSSNLEGSSDAAAAPSAQPQQQQQQELISKEELRAVRAAVFDQHIGDGRRSGRKAILKPLRGRQIASWYFTLTGPNMPMMVNELEEERLGRVELARATGSGPPKKGQGKRAKK